jgi:cation:H+ antiporter
LIGRITAATTPPGSVTAILAFLLSGGVLIAAGVRLARDGEVIAQGTDLGRMWVGGILVAAMTSLPELTTDVSAVWQGTPEVAVGDLFGSSMANMAILALADLLVRQTRVLSRVAVNQLALGALALCLASLAALGILGPDATVLGVGWASAAIIVLYVAGMRWLHRNRAAPPPPWPPQVPRPSAVRRAAVRFGIAGIAILAAAPFLAASTAALADLLGVSRGFAGLAFLAIVTSLPEAVVTTTSVRAGTYDLAVGNLLGSNCFNMVALAVLDVVDGGGSLLGRTSETLVVGALVGMLLTGLAMLGVLDRGEQRPRLVDLGPVVMLLVYVAGVALTWQSQQ